MGDLDQAFVWLEEEFDWRRYVFYLPSDPAFAPPPPDKQEARPAPRSMVKADAVLLKLEIKP